MWSEDLLCAYCLDDEQCLPIPLTSVIDVGDKDLFKVSAMATVKLSA
jgi:hypothetical protein